MHSDQYSREIFSEGREAALFDMPRPAKQLEHN
jgi:hypothetical protein